MAVKQTIPIKASSGGFLLTQEVETNRQIIEGRLEALEGATNTDTPILGILAVPLTGAILAAGTPMGAFADNAASAPGITLDNSKAVAIRWNDAASQVAVWSALDLPIDCDTSYPLTVVVEMSKSGATAADVTSWDIGVFVQTPAALEDATAGSLGLGGTTTALTSAQAAFAAKTITKLTVPIYLPPAPPARLSISFKPTNGTLGTDDAVLNGIWIEYVRKPAVARMQIDMRAAILAAGTPLAAFADNASSNPGITLDNSKAVGVRWNDNATQTAVWTYIDLPLDADITKPMVFVVLASKSGATVGDATTFDIGVFEQAVGFAEDATTGTLGLGGTTSALVGNATAKTVSKLTLGIAPNTFKGAPERLSISIKPTSGTLGTDDGICNGFWLEYTRVAPTAQQLSTSGAMLPIDFKAAILAAGTPMAAFADSASSAPGVTLDNSKAVGVRFNDAATQVAVWSYVELPYDFDVTQPATVVLLASKSGATLADATTFDVGIFEQAQGAAEDATLGTLGFGGTTTALVGNATAKKVGLVTFTIPGKTFAAPPARLSISVKPTNGLLSTDDAIINGSWIEYAKAA